MTYGDAVVGGRGADDPTVIFLSNELVRMAVSSSVDVSTQYLRETRDELTDAVALALSQQQLEQFNIEYHDAERGQQARVVCTITDAGSDLMEEAPVEAVRDALPAFEQSRDIVALSWPVVEGIDSFDPVYRSGTRVGKFGAGDMGVTVDVCH
jgi:hypothetical protein